MQKYCRRLNRNGFRQNQLATVILILAGAMLFFSACSTTSDKLTTDTDTAAPLEKLEPGFYQQGIASWYGHPFHGQATASGEIYDMNDPTAAHKRLPLGTKVLVTNLENQRQIELLINDRGPFVKNRVIDLSKYGARQLGIIQNGTAMVRIDILELPESISHSKKHPFAIQFGAFENREPALKLRDKIARQNDEVFIDEIKQSEGTLYRVRLGWFNSREAAHNEARHLGFSQAHIFRR
ncbi:MAG TPA: septal ring lytic transglycosylase RlpA family protein [Desulfarculaceae bacterium]|nr:septal ring lytic transglycosylase RlpA family protein [Desulfarculaceae bacterium]